MNRVNVPVQRGDRRVVAPEGELDLAAVEALRAAMLITESGPRALVLDLTDVTFIDASTVSVIATTAQQVQQMGGQLSILSPTPNVERVLHLTGLHPLISQRRSR